MVYKGENYRLVYELVAETESFVAIVLKEIYYEDTKLENFVFEACSSDQRDELTCHDEVIVSNPQQLWHNFFQTFNTFRSDEGRFTINPQRIIAEQLFV